MRFQKIFYILLLLFSLSSSHVFSQQIQGIISGPWAGDVQLRNATIWVEVSPDVKNVAVQFNPSSKNANIKTVTYKGELGKDFNPIKIELNGLDINTTYTYSLIIDGKPVSTTYPLKFTTKDLWQWRKPAPDFTFLTGSCAYFNEAIYDRPGKPSVMQGPCGESRNASGDGRKWSGRGIAGGMHCDEFAQRGSGNDFADEIIL